MSSKNNVFHYYVEGECEEKLINTYKKPPYSYFVPGKVEILNVVQKEISRPLFLHLQSQALNTENHTLSLKQIDLASL